MLEPLDSSKEKPDGEITDAERNATRFYYCLLFVLAGTCALVLGLVPPDQFLEKIPGMDMGTASQIQALAVARFSFAMTVFFFVLTISLVGPQSPGDHRERIQYGFWFVKIPVFIGLVVAAFFIPKSFFAAFDYVSRAGSVVFMIVQILILIQFAYEWNAKWVSYDQKIWYGAILAVSVAMLTAALTILICLFVFYGGGGCDLNNFFIAFTLILSVFSLLASFAVKHGALLPSSVIILYCTYVCWSSINGVNEECSRLGGGNDGWVLAVGLIFTLLSLAYQSFNASNSEDALSYSGRGHGSERGDKYCYWFFHFNFCIASLYLNMLITGFRNFDSTEIGTQSVASMWIKMVAQWVVFLLYAWTLAAPYILKNRDFGIDI